MSEEPKKPNPEQPAPQPQVVQVVMQHPPVPPQPSKGFAITSMVTGIVSLIFSLYSVSAMVLGAIALIFGIIAVTKPAGRGMAIAGIATGSITILVDLMIFAFIMTFNSGGF